MSLGEAEALPQTGEEVERASKRMSPEPCPSAASSKKRSSLDLLGSAAHSVAGENFIWDHGRLSLDTQLCSASAQ